MRFLPTQFPIISAQQAKVVYPSASGFFFKTLVLTSTILCGTGALPGVVFAQSVSDPDAGVVVGEGSLFSSSSSSLLRGASGAVESDTGSQSADPFFNSRVQPAQPMQQGRAARTSDDAYEPLGIKLGAFDLMPSIGFYGEASDNVNKSSRRINGSSGRVELELDLQSNWSRHSLSINAEGGIDGYAEPDRKPQHDVNINSDLRLDLQETTRVTLSGGYAYEREAEDNAELRASGLDASNQTTLTGRARIDHEMGLVFAQLRGSVVDESFSNDKNRDNHTLGVGGRLGYRLTDQIAPFVDVAATRKKYDIGVNRQNGDNLRASIGVEVANRAKLSGEASAGYMIWKANAPCCKDDSAFFADARLVWSPDPLWTITGALDTSLTSSSTNARSVLTHTASLGVDYAMRRNLTLSANASLAREDYRGIGRKDWVTNAGLNAEYRVNRNMQFIGRLSHERRESTLDSEDFRANKIELGVKFLK